MQSRSIPSTGIPESQNRRLSIRQRPIKIPEPLIRESLGKRLPSTASDDTTSEDEVIGEKPYTTRSGRESNKLDRLTYLK